MHDSAAPISERFSLDTIIAGLASDLESLRAGRITARQAKASADLAHEIMRGIDLAVRAQKILGDNARQLEAQPHG